MKTKLLYILVIAFTLVSNAQNYQTIQEVDTVCAQLGFSGDEAAEIAVDNILAEIGLFRNFTIQECPDINNAVAKNIDIGEGKKDRYILYDSKFFNRIEDKAANDWAAISILAHEIGHHLNGHALNDEGSNHKWELEADEFSGFVLARMGSSSEDAQSAIQTLKLDRATRTHPAKADRLKAIEKGWIRGSGKIIEVKKITEEKKKEIIKNKEEIVDLNITAEQIIANYIDAIGGQEKIKNIKSISKSYSIPINYGNGLKGAKAYKQIFLTPSKILYMANNIFSELEPSYLVLPKVSYIRDNSNSKWNSMETESNSTDKEISFIKEYSYLVNNEHLIFDGVSMVDNELCYKISVPKKHTSIYYSNINKERVRNQLTRSYTMYYSVKTGLLMVDDIHTVVDKAFLTKRGKIKRETRSSSQHQRMYSDYRSVDGVLFPFKVGTDPNFEIYSEIIINPEIDLNDFDPTK